MCSGLVYKRIFPVTSFSCVNLSELVPENVIKLPNIVLLIILDYTIMSIIFLHFADRVFIKPA